MRYMSAEESLCSWSPCKANRERGVPKERYEGVRDVRLLTTARDRTRTIEHAAAAHTGNNGQHHNGTPRARRAHRVPYSVEK